jgi:hypothetical protein
VTEKLLARAAADGRLHDGFSEEPRVAGDAATINQQQTPTVTRRELFADFAVGRRL